MVFKRLPRRRAGIAVAALAASLLAGGALDAEAANKRQVERAPEPPPPKLSGTAVLAVVSLAHQRVALYDAAGNVLRASISSGQTGLDTPVGVYSVLQKEEEHHSNLYDDASMPYMQRITWSGVALHAGALPGYPASHGCVRLPYSFAQNIYGQTRLGLRVVISNDDVAPVPMTHPALFQPAPPGEATARTQSTAYTPADEAEAGNPFMPELQSWPARQRQQEELKAIAVEKAAAARVATEKAVPFAAELKKKTAETSKALRGLRAAEEKRKDAQGKLNRTTKWLASAKRPREIKQAEEAKAKAETALANAESELSAERVKAQPATDILAAATQAANAAEAEKAAAIKAAKDAELRMLPVSVFISRATKRLYIRQGYEPVLDVPVTIRNPDRPIGTHIFTATDYADGGSTVRWTAVSLAPPSQAYAVSDYDDEYYGYQKKRRRVAMSDAPPVPTDQVEAATALDRITIPPEVSERIAASVWPGSSLIISDEEASKETGKATDFIVLVSGYPQGGIKKRKKQAPDYYFRFDDDYYGSYYYSDRRRRQRPYGGKGLFGFW